MIPWFTFYPLANFPYSRTKFKFIYAAPCGRSLCCERVLSLTQSTPFWNQVRVTLFQFTPIIISWIEHDFTHHSLFQPITVHFYPSVKSYLITYILMTLF